MSSRTNPQHRHHTVSILGLHCGRIGAGVEYNDEESDDEDFIKMQEEEEAKRRKTQEEEEAKRRKTENLGLWDQGTQFYSTLESTEPLEGDCKTFQAPDRPTREEVTGSEPHKQKLTEYNKAIEDEIKRRTEKVHLTCKDDI